MKKYLFLGLILTAVNLSAQRFIDDIYFTPKDAQQEHVQTKGRVKNGAREVVFVNTEEDLQLPDTLEGGDEELSSLTTDSAVMYIAEGSYPNGFKGSMDDFEYTQRIYRFHNPRIAVHISDPAYHDIYFLDNDLWNVYIDPYNYAYVTPTWTNPYYWDYMYRPYSYSSWAWRWNPYGAWGWNSYWGWNTHWGWDPYWGYTGYWNYYDPFWGYPHWGHHHHHHHHFHPSHGHHADRLAFNQEGQRRRDEGVRLGSQIDRRAAIMGGSSAGNRVNTNTIISSTSPQGGRETSNAGRVTSRRTATSTHRVGASTSVRPATSQRPVSTQSRVSATARTGSSEVRRTTATQYTGTTRPTRHSSSVSSGRTYTSGGSRSVTTSRGQISGGSSTSGRSSYSPQHSVSRSSSSSSSYRSSSPSSPSSPSRSSSSYRSGSSSTSYRSSSSSSRSSSSYSSSHSSGSSYSGGRSSGGGRR